MTLHKEGTQAPLLLAEGALSRALQDMLPQTTVLYIDRSALEDFFSSPTMLIFEADAFGALIEQLPRSIAIFEIDSALVIRGWRIPVEGQLIPLAGIPVNCSGFVLNTGQGLTADVLTRFWAQHGPASLPPVIWRDSPMPDSQALFLRLLQAIAEDHCSALRQWSDSQRQLAYLRQKNEWLSLQLSKAKALLDSRGASTGLVSCLPPGARTMGPQGDVVCTRCQQLLPASIAGVRQIALHAVVPAPPTQGRLYVEVIRSANLQPIGRWSVDYLQLRSGWFTLALPASAEGMHGDCLLRVSWATEQLGPTPLLAIADAHGTGAAQNSEPPADDRSLALMMWSGIADPGPDNVHQSDPRPLPETYCEALNLRAIAPWVIFATGEEHQSRVAAALGITPWQVCEDEYLFLHPVAGEISAVAVPQCPPVGTRSVQAGVLTAHPSAHPIAYTLMVWRGALPVSEDRLRYWVELSSRTGSRLVAPELSAITAVAPAEQRHWITLELDPGDTRPTHLILAVRSPSQIVDFAWCRWYDLSFRIAFPTDVLDVASTHPTSPQFVT